MAVVRTLIGGTVGGAIALLLYGTLLPFWAVSPLGATPNDAVDILFVDYQHPGIWQLGKNPVYIQTQSRDIYFSLENGWEILSPLPNGQMVSQVWLRDDTFPNAVVAVADQGSVYQMIDGQWKLIQNHKGKFGGKNASACAQKMASANIPNSRQCWCRV